MGIDYTVLYKHEISEISALSQYPIWDYFISAYNLSDRVRSVYDAAPAKSKTWVLHHEYQLTDDKLPASIFRTESSTREDEFILTLIKELIKNGFDSKSSRICIDITGLMRPHLLYLVRYFFQIGLNKFDMIYSEPQRYSKKEDTAFAGGEIDTVRQVAGFEGITSQDPGQDLLLIGLGYDHNWLTEIAEEKEKAQKILLYGFPPLRADMYQESVLRTYKAADSLGGDSGGFFPASRIFAPANDPFATASVLSETIRKKRIKETISHLYLSPLGTKAQTLGFALYYVSECIDSNTSIIFPFSPAYEPETGEGFAKAWVYTVEFLRA